MTRTISLIIGIAVVALVAVPAALGAYGLGDAPGTSSGPDAVTFFYENERATMPLPAAIHDHGNATEAKSPAGVAAVAYFYANERATMPLPPAIHDHGNATQAKLLVQSPAMNTVRDNGDATQAKLALLSLPVVGDHGDAQQAMFEARSSGPSVAGVGSDSGLELDWSQLAIGFGIGIVLATVLGLALRATRPRTLVH
jgi:hypothetical protein